MSSCFGKQPNKFDLVVARDTEHDLTRNRVYVVLDYVGSDTVEIKNDLGKIEYYSTEYFRFYQGEKIGL